MGARTNYTIVTTDNPDQNINVYAHWDGDESVMILAKAISKAMPRLGDNSYFTRILIDNLMEDHNTETGYGIYVGPINHEEQYEYKEVNLVTDTVTVGSASKPIKDFIAYHLEEVLASK